MDTEIMPKPYSEREVDLGKFVRSFTGVLYWGKEKQPGGLRTPWVPTAEDLFPNEINVIEKERNVSVMGFGGDFDEAYNSCLAKLEERLDRRGWDFVLIGNGLPLRNGANFQYHMSATLYKIDRNYRAPTSAGLQKELVRP